ncbi:hypothetical protein [Mycetocola sp.]|uniref:hypothetical protein n=1 Tax=Mycetocola sp. TaxID=1871042 RepID=UPI0039894F28
MSDRINTENTRRQVAYARARQAQVAADRALTEPEPDDREPTPSERQAAYARGDGRPDHARDVSTTQRQANAAIAGR